MAAADEQIAFEHIAREWRMKYSENEVRADADCSLSGPPSYTQPLLAPHAKLRSRACTRHLPLQLLLL